VSVDTGTRATTPAAAPGEEAARLVELSVRRYRRAHRRYERRHPEIFNAVEQARLREELARAIGAIESASGPAPRALDLGCGTGNLTRRLLELGADVLAADVSPQFLRQVERGFGATGRVETLRLNGHDLANVADGSLDLVCLYSVLHHIPDYLAAVDEVCRVLAPGGVAYLDHEANERFWDRDGCFRALLRAAETARYERLNRWNRHMWWHPPTRRWQRFLIPSKYVTRLRQVFNPAYPWDVEGDIHVWEHDHVEWDRVEERLLEGGCEIVRRCDYLNHSGAYPAEVWERFAQSCTNMRLVVARRAEAPA
jgi:SAM-dependent methyltransferase